MNVGTPVDISGDGKKKILSGIVKRPISGKIKVRKLNLDGDRQADLSVHGGIDKAVYVYPSEHYSYWKEKYPNMEFVWGTFGENFTTEGLVETQVHIGDKFEIGSAKFEVTQPRFPSFKLGIRFQDNSIIKSFLESDRSGFYLKVLREGQVQAGDEVRTATMNMNTLTIASIVQAEKQSLL